MSEILTLDVQHMVGVEDGLAEPLWELFSAAFTPLQALAAERQLLTREEFVGLVTNPRVESYIGFADAGRPVVYAALTQDISLLTWVNPHYYARRWPTPTIESRLYYMAVACVDRHWQGRGYYRQVLEPIMRRLKAERAVLGWDACGHNDDALSILSIFRREADRQGVAMDGALVDTQRFYVLTLDDTPVNSDGTPSAGSGRLNR